MSGFWINPWLRLDGMLKLLMSILPTFNWADTVLIIANVNANWIFLILYLSVNVFQQHDSIRVWFQTLQEKCSSLFEVQEVLDYDTLTVIWSNSIDYEYGLLMLNTGGHVPVCLRWHCSAFWELVLSIGSSSAPTLMSGERPAEPSCV